MKEKVTFSIDKETMKLVREHIPNASKFVEECFKAYFQFTTENDEQRGEELRKSWEEFHQAKIKIHLLMNVDYENKYIEKVHEENKKLAWLGIWKTYKFTETYQPHAMEEACKVLNLTEEELKVVLEDTGFAYAKDKTKAYIFDSWKYIEENILPHINLEEDEEIERLLKEVMG